MAKDEDKIPLTKEGLAELKEEYERLKEEKRPKIVERMSKSRNIGDFDEDPEYAQAKQELAFLDGKLAELEEVLARVKVVDSQKKGGDEVVLGCQVTVSIRGGEHVFHLVGEWEADPASMKISHQSPLGQALLGKKVGDQVEVKAPAGKITYKIVKVN